MRHRVVAALVGTLGLLVVAGPTRAERAEVVYSRGLVAYHAGRYAEALGFFDQAVSTDPGDVQARYYRGLTQGRLGNYAAAVADLEAVVAARPDFEQAPLELGVALVEAGRYRDALPWLQRAAARPDQEGRASFFLGLALLRLDDLDAAGEQFVRAAQRDPTLAVPARYYEGMVAYRAQRYEQAHQHFAYVVTYSPETDMGRAAAQFVERLRTAALPAAARPYRLFGEAGLQYDDNVQLLPLDDNIQFIGPSRRGDGRAVLLAGGEYAPPLGERVELAVGYVMSQSLHFHLTEFNLQDHRPNVQLLVNLQPVRLGIAGMYDYYLRETDSFLSQGTVVPWVSVEGARGLTELFMRMRRSDFLERPENGVLDAWNLAPGIRQSVYLDGPERYVFGEYRFEREDTTHTAGDAFAFDSNQFGAGVGWAFPWDVRAQLAYAYWHQWYDNASNGRRDEQHQLVFGTSKDLSANLTLTLGYFGTFNNSNQAAFRYDRNIGSVALAVRY